MIANLFMLKNKRKGKRKVAMLQVTALLNYETNLRSKTRNEQTKPLTNRLSAFPFFRTF